MSIRSLVHLLDMQCVDLGRCCALVKVYAQNYVSDVIPLNHSADTTKARKRKASILDYFETVNDVALGDSGFKASPKNTVDMKTPSRQPEEEQCNSNNVLTRAYSITWKVFEV
ncbi:uncharacterized protein LOC128221837 isoform X3 [Mya arenaria]|uniref:uncharacterized protein LOC128221837 isoform X3 n=1 Tax=Mya arenaria TaxID=6604 RepID=UPI0022E3E9B3|nr:uncharacterized protein LOC128221837 isoform X3 [Mya arenaria]